MVITIGISIMSKSVIIYLDDDTNYVILSEVCKDYKKNLKKIESFCKLLLSIIVVVYHMY